MSAPHVDLPGPQPSASGTSSTASKPFSTTRSTASATPATCAASCRIPIASAAAPNDCYSEPASAGEESAVPSAAKKQIPRFARSDKGRVMIGMTRGCVVNGVTMLMCFASSGRASVRRKFTFTMKRSPNIGS